MSFLLKKNKFFLKLSRIIIALIILMLFSFGFSSYEGNQFFYILFALTNIYLIYFSFRKKATFFETFFGTLLFLGFGFKFSAVISFTDGMFREGVGNFDYSSKSFDYSLLVSSIGIITFIVFGHIREFFFVYPKKIKSINFNQNLYISNRTKIISAFILLVLIICFLNIYFAIYQKGLIPTQDYNFFFSGFIKWSLLYGLTCLAALMIFFEINSFKKVFNLTVIIGIIETFLSSISMISRGMIFNSLALIFGIYKYFKKIGFKLSKTNFLFYIFSIIILFYISVVSVNYIRSNYFYIGKSVQDYKKTTDEVKDIKPEVKKKFNIIDSNNEFFYLAVNRWVGIDAVLAVSQNKDKLNFSLFKEALKEKFIKDQPTFYEKTFYLEETLTESLYENAKGNTLTGIIAFLFYPGSFVFLIFGVAFLTSFGNFLEYLSYRLSEQNLIFCCLIGQIIAFRYIHFGYLPKQSYLLFGSLVATIFAVGLGMKIIKKKNNL